LNPFLTEIFSELIFTHCDVN